MQRDIQGEMCSGKISKTERRVRLETEVGRAAVLKYRPAARRRSILIICDNRKSQIKPLLERKGHGRSFKLAWKDPNFHCIYIIHRSSSFSVTHACTHHKHRLLTN